MLKRTDDSHRSPKSAPSRDIALDANLFRFVWRHSRRDQIFVLAMIAVSLPFYFISLDIPKRIVNEALQGRAFPDGALTAKLFEFSIALPSFLGGGLWQVSPGLDLDRYGYLFALSGFFLVLVLINGAFKYAINIAKGVLGERMLRRMRFNMFALLMDFRPEEIRTVKPAEAASMIKDEVEPIGGFVGDAFIQPAFLLTQALTALTFIILQSFWLGMVSLAVILIQAFVIPSLRREQIRLGRERQIASRKLAGRIGDLVEGAPAVSIHGTQAFQESEIGSRLGRLFNIRVQLFKRKFAVKYLNNILAQITPFFFYAIGGYYALRGEIDIGQLVAVIAAYRDLPPPIKELIDWDQQRADVTVKYQQLLLQFAPERAGLPTLPPVRAAAAAAAASDVATPAPTAVPVTTAPPAAPLSAPLAAMHKLAIDALSVRDRRGNVTIDVPHLALELPAHVCITGISGSGRDILGKVIGRQISEYRGSVRWNGADIRAIPIGQWSRRVAYAGTETLIFSGTIRDNVVFALQRCEPSVEATTAAEEAWISEAHRSGNPPHLARSDWIDYEAADIDGPDDLDRAVLQSLSDVGMLDTIHSLGLQGRMPAGTAQERLTPFIEARSELRRRLEARQLSHVIEPFDPRAYNRNSTIGENLLFGTASGERLAGDGLAGDPYFNSILRAEALSDTLIEFGARIAEITLEVFRDFPPGHMLVERFSMISAEQMPEFEAILTDARLRKGARRVKPADRVRLITLALAYTEQKHRLGLVDRQFVERALRARTSFHRHLPSQYAQEIEFYEEDRFLFQSSIRDNLLFGRTASSAPEIEAGIEAAIREVLAASNLESTVLARGLDTEVGPSGKLLFQDQRMLLNLARCLVRHPELLIVDGALFGFSSAQRRAVLALLRKRFSGKSLIVTLPDDEGAGDFDDTLAFDGPKLAVRDASGASGPAAGSERPDRRSP